MIAARLSYHFAPLGDTHDRAAFSCGVESLDRFFREQATQFARRNPDITFVMVERATNSVMEYYTLCPLSILAQTISEGEAKRLPNRIPIPATLIGRRVRDGR